MSEYKPNSHRFKEEQRSSSGERKKLEKVVKGTAKVRKKSEIRKFTDVFFTGDAAEVKDYLVHDFLIPSAKTLFYDFVLEGLGRMLDVSSSRGGRGSSSISRAPYVNYNSKYSDRRDDRHSSDSRGRVGYNVNDIVLPNRNEAEEVLSRMDELIDTYGTVSVADLYDLVGITGNYTDNKYGWTNIRNAEPIRVRDGYLLKLPKVGPI